MISPNSKHSHVRAHIHTLHTNIHAMLIYTTAHTKIISLTLSLLYAHSHTDTICNLHNFS